MYEAEIARLHQRWMRKILTYLIDNPDAKDTVEGITNWWLGENDLENCRDGVEKVLSGLVDCAWLKARQITPSQRIYGINKEFLPEIKNYLRKIGD